MRGLVVEESESSSLWGLHFAFEKKSCNKTAAVGVPAVPHRSLCGVCIQMCWWERVSGRWVPRRQSLSLWVTGRLATGLGAVGAPEVPPRKREEEPFSTPTASQPQRRRTCRTASQLVRLIKSLGNLNLFLEMGERGEESMP